MINWFGELQLLQVNHCLPVDCSLALLHYYRRADDVSFLKVDIEWLLSILKLLLDLSEDLTARHGWVFIGVVRHGNKWSVDVADIVRFVKRISLGHQCVVLTLTLYLVPFIVAILYAMHCLSTRINVLEHSNAIILYHHQLGIIIGHSSTSLLRVFLLDFLSQFVVK